MYSSYVSSTRHIGSTYLLPKALYRAIPYKDIVLNRAIGGNGKEYRKKF